MLERAYRSFFNPWDESSLWRREFMNRLLSDWLGVMEDRPAPTYPAMNVWMNEEGAIITAELPGIAPEDLDISVVGDTLTVSGERKPEELKEGETYHRRERGYGKFSRAFQLPFEVEADKVSATFKNGVLHITLPRAEADKPRKIAVKAA